MKLFSLSENTVVVLFEQKISAEISAEVLQFTQLVEAELSTTIIDIVPSYASIHITFNLRKKSHQDFIQALDQISKNITPNSAFSKATQIVEIPIYYAEEVGFDLLEVSKKSGLTIDQVIERHSAKTYDVYALGFSPGFAYLGNVHASIALPRKKTPRQTVPKGSLGIAGEQTAVYPFNSPGGWQIIGRTPIELVDYASKPPCIMQVGDKIKFVPISRDEFLQRGGVL